MTDVLPQHRTAIRSGGAVYSGAFGLPFSRDPTDVHVFRALHAVCTGSPEKTLCCAVLESAFHDLAITTVNVHADDLRRKARDWFAGCRTAPLTFAAVCAALELDAQCWRDRAFAVAAVVPASPVVRSYGDVPLYERCWLVLRRACKPVPRRWVAAKLGITPTSAMSALADLVRLGGARRVRQGWYEAVGDLGALEGSGAARSDGRAGGKPRQPARAATPIRPVVRLVTP